MFAHKPPCVPAPAANSTPARARLTRDRFVEALQRAEDGGSIRPRTDEVVAPVFDREAGLAGCGDDTRQCDPVAEMLSRRWNRSAARDISSNPIARHCQISAQQT